MRNKEKIIGGIVLFVILLVFLMVGYINTKPKKITEKEMEDMFVEVNTSAEKTKKGSSNTGKKSGEKITVEIKGAVQKPGVYVMESDSVVKDLITEAGGLSAKGDVNNINQAKLLINHECIVINEIGQVTAGNVAQGVSLVVKGQGVSSDGKVNINTASAEELDKLPGIGAQYAQRIVDYRDNKGQFQSIEDIMKVEGIKTGVFNKIKEKITVN